jgi:uncharacterized protein with HEPN domain
MRPDDHIRVLHMIEAIQTATEFVSGRQAADLETDRMLLFALVRAIEVVGEAAGKVSDELRLRAPDIPWNLIVSMRNRLIHAYFDIDRGILWKTATIELQALLPRLQALIRKG